LNVKTEGSFKKEFTFLLFYKKIQSKYPSQMVISYIGEFNKKIEAKSSAIEPHTSESSIKQIYHITEINS